MALLFAAEGAKVVVADIAAEKVANVAAEIQAGGGTATAVVVDVANEEQVNRMVDTAVDEYGRLDILVNNAGVVDAIMPAGEAEPSLWRRVLSINLDGTFYACHRALPIMEKQGSGSIVNVASVAGVRGGRGGAAYTASKHGMVGLTMAIAQYYLTKGIRCNVLCPGSIETGIPIGGQAHKEAMERLMHLAAVGPRLGKPEEVARVALFLASDEASYVNGAVLLADGGWTAM